MNAWNSYGSLVGRILIALIFVLAGFGKVTGFDGTVSYIASKGLPLPQLGAIVAILVELGGGTLLILGWKARWAAGALFIFSAMTALFFHNFWTLPADQAQNQMIHFLKNISMMGGLMYVIVHGSGALSLGKDSMTRK
jgi:putative oxidoreductase